jgi:hypothetical protein
MSVDPHPVLLESLELHPRVLDTTFRKKKTRPNDTDVGVPLQYVDKRLEPIRLLREDVTVQEEQVGRSRDGSAKIVCAGKSAIDSAPDPLEGNTVQTQEFFRV